MEALRPSASHSNPDSERTAGHGFLKIFMDCGDEAECRLTKKINKWILDNQVIAESIIVNSKDSFGGLCIIVTVTYRGEKPIP